VAGEKLTDEDRETLLKTARWAVQVLRENMQPSE
jgi:uncharacterized membrane protein